PGRADASSPSCRCPATSPCPCPSRRSACWKSRSFDPLDQGRALAAIMSPAGDDQFIGAVSAARLDRLLRRERGEEPPLLQTGDSKPEVGKEGGFHAMAQRRRCAARLGGIRPPGKELMLLG